MGEGMHAVYFPLVVLGQVGVNQGERVMGGVIAGNELYRLDIPVGAWVKGEFLNVVVVEDCFVYHDERACFPYAAVVVDDVVVRESAFKCVMIVRA